jgi:hypothetical protein
MSIAKLSIVGAVALTGILLPATLEHRSQVQLREENKALREQLRRLSRVAADNERLSNVVAQAKIAQDHANRQFEELLRLRKEVGRWGQRDQPDSASMVSLAQHPDQEQATELQRLQEEVRRLQQENQELEALREEVRQLRAAASSAPAEEASAAQTEATEDRPLSIRLIRTQGASFAEKLKRSVGAQESETFQEVFARFLQANGIQPGAVAAAAYDERTGRVIVRATPAVLEQIDRLTTALDQSP